MKMPLKFWPWLWWNLKTDRLTQLQWFAWCGGNFVYILGLGTWIALGCQLYCLFFSLGCVAVNVHRTRKTRREYNEGIKRVDFFEQECRRLLLELKDATEGWDVVAIRDAQQRYEIASSRFNSEAEKVWPGFNAELAEKIKKSNE